MNDSIQQNYVKPEPFERDLPVKLTDAELLQRGTRAAQIMADIQRKNASLDAVKTTVKAQIKELAAEAERIQSEVLQREAVKTVRCERRFVYRTGMVQEVRLDTFEVIDERSMNERERQPNLPGVSDEPKPAAEDFAAPEEEDDDHDEDGFFTQDETPEQRAAIRPPMPGHDVDEDPDLSILDSTPTHDEARDTDVPPPELATEKRPKGSRGKKNGGGK